MFTSTKLELISEDLSACRACLATNTNLYSISDGLEDKFIELMGVEEYSDDDGLPQHLCPYCRMQLLRFADLRMRCHRSQELLKGALKKQPYLSTDNILSIDRNFHKLALNLVKLSVYTFNSHEKKITETEPEDLKMKVTNDDENYDDREELIEETIETIDPIDPLIEDVNTQINKDITNKVHTETKPKGLCLEIDGINGQIKIKNTKEKDKEKKRMLEQYNKRQKEKQERKQKFKEQSISNLIKFVAGEKPSAQSLSKWQMQLRRAENNYLPNFDHAQFEREHDCKIEILTTEEQLAEIEQRKQSTNYLNLNYKCETCGRGFEFEQPYKNHMAKHDKKIGSGRFPCEICRIYFRMRSLKYRHLDMHKMKFTCNICSFVSRAKHLAKNHYLMHTGKVYKCKHCDATFTKSTSYLGHVRINHPSKDAVCEICGDAFVGALGLLHHKARVHKTVKPRFKCKSCGALFRSAEARSRHRGERRECDANMRPCVECGEVFTSEELLKAHTDENHVPAQFYCKECDQTFLSQASYDTHHQRIHLKLKWPAYGRTPEMNKQYCRKASERAKGRERAKRKTLVVCEICGAKLVSNAALGRHQQSGCKRESTKRYQCPYCDKTCATRQGLQEHLHTHTGEKPYRCDICPLDFRHVSNLKRHRRVVHLNQRKSFPCALCDKTYATRDSLKLHVNTVHQKMPWPKRKRRKQDGEN